MLQDETMAALEQLQREVAQLKASQQKAQHQVTPEPEVSADTQESSSTTTQHTPHIEVDDSTADIHAHPNAAKPIDEQAQLDELMGLLSKEVKELPTITTLAVFSLGLLMGRYLR